MSNNHLHSILINAVVFKDNQVLISQRSWDEPHMPGRWTIPGGKVDVSEEQFNILEKTLVREVLEETGVSVDEKSIALVTNNSFVRGSDNQHVVVIVFKCDYLSGDPQPLDDTIDCRWASLEEIKAIDFPPNVKEYILKAFAK